MTNLLCALPAGVHTAAVVSCLPVPATDLLWLGLLLVFKFYIIHNSTFTTDETSTLGWGTATPTELLLLTACQIGRISILHSGWYASRRLHYLSATHIATPVTFGLELPLLTGSLWVGYGLVIGINYVDVVGVGWGRSWLVRTPGNSDRVAIS